MGTSRSGARILRAAAVLTVFAIGGLLGGVIPGGVRSADAMMPPHPCQNQECESFWWIDWCQGNAGGGTYCDTDQPGVDCQSKGCDHA